MERMSEYVRGDLPPIQCIIWQPERECQREDGKYLNTLMLQRYTVRGPRDHTQSSQFIILSVTLNPVLMKRGVALSRDEPTSGDDQQRSLRQKIGTEQSCERGCSVL